VDQPPFCPKFTFVERLGYPNCRDGRTLGSFIAMPYLGLVIPMGERFFFAPQVGYVHSFSKTVSGTNYRVLTAETGIAYIAENGFWISYFPQVLRDLESNEWAIDHRLVVGMMFSPRFGMSFDYVFVDRYSFGSNLPVVEVRSQGGLLM